MFKNMSWFDLDKLTGMWYTHTHTHLLSSVVIPKPMHIMRKRQFHTGTLHAAIKVDTSVNVSVCGGISFCCNFWIQM